MKKIVLALTLALGLFACSKSSDTASKPVRDKLVVAQEGEPKSLDIHNGNDGFSLRINKVIYSRLVESDADMNIVPGLAESWKALDEKTTQFKLREGVKFHNGDPLTAEDVKFSIERMLKSPRISFVLPPIEKIEVVDPLTVNIVTTTPFGPLLAHLSHPALGIVSKKQLEADPEALQKTPTGTGPYKFKEWLPGDRVTLERNDEYFGTKPSFKDLVIRNIVEASSRTIALETGEVDIALGIASVDEENIKNNKRLALVQKPSISYNYIGFNNKKEKFSDVRVRKAINLAIDKEAIVKAILNGGGRVANSPIAPGVFGHSDKTKAYAYNVEEAKALMKEAGLENGFETSIYVLAGETPKQIAEIVQANLHEIGITMAINSVEAGTYWDITGKGQHDMFLGSWGCVTGDADYGLYAMFHTSGHGDAGNRTFYSNPEVDKLLDAGKTTTDQEKRKEIYEKVQELIVNDAPDVMLFNANVTVGTQADLNFKVHPVTLHNFADVTFKN